MMPNHRGGCWLGIGRTTTTEFFPTIIAARVDKGAAGFDQSVKALSLATRLQLSTICVIRCHSEASMDASAVGEFVTDQMGLLALESEAQRRHTRAIFRTYPSEVRTVSQAKGNLGGTVITVVPLDGRVDGMRVGSWVELSAVAGQRQVKGLVVSQEPSEVGIHVPLTDAKDGEIYRIRGVPFNFRKHFHQNLEEIQCMPPNWRGALFGGQPLEPIAGMGALIFQDQGLDQSQQSAVSFVLSRPDLALVWGPPGEGKPLCSFIAFTFSKARVKLGLRLR